MLNYLKYYILGIFVSVCFLEFSAHSSCILTKASGYPHPSCAICQPCHMSQLPCRCVGFRCANINSISGALALPKPPSESIQIIFPNSDSDKGSMYAPWRFLRKSWVSRLEIMAKSRSNPWFPSTSKSHGGMTTIWRTEVLVNLQVPKVDCCLLWDKKRVNGCIFPEEKNAKTVDSRIQDDPSFFKSTCR